MISPRDIGLPAKFPAFRSYPGFSQWDVAAGMASVPKRYIGQCAPPGTGKSVTNFAASRIMDAPRTLYLTVNKPLQSQLMRDFADSDIRLFNLVGHSSYPCMSKSYDDAGDLSDTECEEGRDNCTYWRDVTLSLSRSHVSSNYHNWISIAKVGDPDRFGKFDVLILDEAHNVESLLCDLLSIKLSKRAVWDLISVSLPKWDDAISIWISWAKESLRLCNTSISESRRVDKINGLAGRESRHTKRLKRLEQNLVIISEISDEWVCEQTTSGVQLTPVFASAYAERYLFRGIPKIILSSATLTSQDFHYLGIAPDDFHLFDIESGFPPARRPFIYWPTLEIDYDTMKYEGCVRQLVNRLDKLIDSRLDRKGITHSVSYAYAELFKSTSRHEITTHTSRNSQHVVSRFMSDPTPSHLASPVIGEGLDFKGDLARYQFFWKVPTLYSGNPLIAARKKRHKKYALYCAGKIVLQDYGRIMREIPDWGESFILDKHWGNWMVKAIPWPLYFRRAWMTVRDAPKPLTL